VSNLEWDVYMAILCDRSDDPSVWARKKLQQMADRIHILTTERDEARRIAAYQYSKHSNYGDESFAMKNFFQFHKWEYLKEDNK